MSEWDMQRQEESGEFMQHVVFSLLVLLSVMLYYTLSDAPGLCSLCVKCAQGSSEELEMIPQNPTPCLCRCGSFLLQQPMRARYCQTCKHCIWGFDHHCPWIENCVGERNYRRFIIYLAVQLLALLWAHQIAWSGFHSAATWKLWLNVNGFLLAALCVVLVVVLLLGCHLYLISINSNAWEFMSQFMFCYQMYYRVEVDRL
ncbi:LOW QUALITY PROTEIN: palmitoyltransferase ZDHHC12-A [Salvelinus alpinus]